MIRVAKEFTFDSAHRLRGHDRACQYLHGHTWRVVVGYQTNELIESGSSRGMVMDFSEVKERIQGVVRMYDHQVILERRDPLIAVLNDADQQVRVVDFRPTAENFARAILEYTRADYVRVYETPNNYAETYRDGCRNAGE